MTKKTVPWKWTPEHEAQFQEIKQKLSSLRLLGTPAPDGEFVVITDASLAGGGGTRLQRQQYPGAAAKRIADELRTVGVNRDGSLKHNYNSQEFHLVCWNWKWSSTRTNYSMYERELLSGILLISGLSRLFGSNSVVWLCDEESTETFLKGAPPENRKVRRWWMFLAQLKLNIYRVPSLKTEVCDWPSRENFGEKISASSESLSGEVFQKMDVHLDLTMSKAEVLSSLPKSDYVEEYGDIYKALGDGSYALVDKELWSLSSSGILRKDVQTCIPNKALGAALQWTHDVLGYRGPDSWLWAPEKMFHTRVPDTELTQKIEEMHRTCKECVTSKRNPHRNRGFLGVLPLPHVVNALLYVDFIDRPKCHNYNYALMSAFCQVVPCKKTIDGEGVLELIKHHWIRFYGPPVRIHSDKDIRFKGDYGWYRNVFTAMGVEVSSSQPYRPQSNGLCERMNDEYQRELRILRQSTKTKQLGPVERLGGHMYEPQAERKIWLFTRRRFPWRAYSTFGPTLST